LKNGLIKPPSVSAFRKAVIDDPKLQNLADFIPADSEREWRKDVKLGKLK